MASSPDFYVTLKMNEQEFQTDTVRGSTSPKFLKDVRLEVEDPENDILRMEMLQVGSKGDCVVGSEKVSIKPLVQSGTLVQWFNLSDAGGTVGAELCLVLRYSTGDKTPQKTGKSKSRSPEPRRQSPAPAARSPSQTPKKKKGKKKKGSMILPLPLAIAGGMLAGCVAFLWSRRSMYYEVKEGDTLCKIGLCFNRPYSELYNVNSKIITDPNLIYPGDKIRIA
eukprot:CAMPEP_0117666200 /NCGR_PEP_ID=MMETSP0804-20121206/10241_1 /TAXON_ID=1074897 /ORGANISM="Tetraselmis astigmatica, Strain CCMP880" /LENGTH=222 /DNA_ID=CAMNT_0005473713 /DNA_START=143 /DNA_END=811 /DNA_ORIENTATION=-